ncbi:unnamed protein product [Cylicostephanus goldi]|uniref:Uncharacterized protein n=1 Tax=Cylicostephanus goldi TaxID=71465 RepID=A0A3P6V2I5_CYLGO|nr:unnamed protein product [Cylicostephanus goldi]
MKTPPTRSPFRLVARYSTERRRVLAALDSEEEDITVELGALGLRVYNMRFDAAASPNENM